MIKIRNILILLAIFYEIHAAVESQGEATGKVKHVFVTFLQQEVEPVNYPGGLKIKEQNGYWNPKLSQEGRKTAYDLGEYLARYYTNSTGIKSSKWNEEYYTAYKSGTNTSAEAALIVAAGFRQSLQDKNKQYSDTDFNGVTSEYVNAIDTFLAEEDKEEHAPCKKFNEHLEKVKSNLKDTVGGDSNKELQAIHGGIKKIYNVEELNNLVTYIKDPYKLWLGYETLKMMKTNEAKFRFPTWATDQVMNHLKKISEEFLYKLIFGDEKVKKIIGGGFVNDILKTMESLTKENTKVTENITPALKIPISENSKLTYFISSLPAFAAQVAAFSPKGTKYKNEEIKAEYFYPEHGAMLVLQLYKDSDEDTEYKVKVLYKQKKNDVMQPLILPNCSDNGDCTFDKFKSNFDSIKLEDTDIENECENPTKTN